MSAIAGLWRFDDRPGVARDLSRMLSALRPYGADHSANWVDGPIGMGRCLHRMVPEDRFDRQPLSTADGRLILVADVRLDNREDLARALGLSVAGFNARCDAELLLDCVSAWGAGAVARLVGDFALAWWDAHANILTLARDYRGNRPLYFARANGLIAFASMAKGLHALADIPYASDPAAAANFLLVEPGATTASFWAGVNRVPPGGMVALSRTGQRVTQYWNPPRPDRAAPPTDYVEGVRHYLDQAVAARLRGVREAVGVHLSAGLDSAAVTSTAARLMAAQGRITAFTAVPDPDHPPVVMRGRIADEGPLAALTAAAYGNIDHVRVSGGSASPLAGLDRDFHLYETPLLNRCNMGWSTAILDEARRRGIGVVLSGEIGNLSLSYSGEAYLLELVHTRRWLELTQVAIALLRSGALSGRGLVARTVLPMLPVRLQDRIRRYVGASDDGPRRYAALRPCYLAHAGYGEGSGAPDGFAQRLRALGRHDPGNYYKGYIAGWGVDQRDPTSDRRLVEYMLAVPMREFVAGGQFRSLVRRALADRVPAAVLDERRKGLQAADWYRGLDRARRELRAELDQIATCPDAAALLDLERLERLERDWPERDWGSASVALDYRTALLRAVSVGHFLRKARRSNG